MTHLLPFAFAMPVAVFAGMAVVCCALVAINEPRPRHWVAYGLLCFVFGFVATDLIWGWYP